jgi:membrane-associated protein
MVMAVAAAGAIFGDNAGYWIGRTAGRPLIDRFGRWILLTPERVARIQAYFARHGDKTILVARFITGLRVFAALFAGISHMRWPVFLLYNAAGAVLWSVAVSLLGYLFGASLPILQQWIGRTGLIILGLIVVGILVSLWLRRRVRPSPPPPGSEPG